LQETDKDCEDTAIVVVWACKRQTRQMDICLYL